MSSASKRVRAAGVATAVILCLGLSSTVLAEVPVAEAQATVAVFKKADPGVEGFLRTAAGYVVFPTVTKGAFLVGGAGGSGVLFENEKPAGKTSLGQATIGLQAGGQAYSEIIFFENAATLSDFKKGNFGLAAQVSAVALSAGAAATAKYESGVAVFTATKTGFMVEASVGGQWFHYEPFPDCPSPRAPVAAPTAPVGVRPCDARALLVVAGERSFEGGSSQPSSRLDVNECQRR
jgi:Las17-binding protein actin regulator